jgi:histidine triad (HIT) family protein
MVVGRPNNPAVLSHVPGVVVDARSHRSVAAGAYRRHAVPADDRDDTDPACVFCRVLSGADVAHEVWRDDVAVAFLDRSPLFPGHTLVIPTRHAITITDLAPHEIGPFFERVQRIAAVMPIALDAQGTFVANNNIVSQSVAHLHVHVVPRTKGDGLRGFFWPRQRYASGEAAACAARLRVALGTLPDSER